MVTLQRLQRKAADRLGADRNRLRDRRAWGGQLERVDHLAPCGPEAHGALRRANQTDSVPWLTPSWLAARVICSPAASIATSRRVAVSICASVVDSCCAIQSRSSGVNVPPNSATASA